MKQKLINFYMKAAQEAAALSYCERLKVGCVVVKDDSIISFGYNGTFSGEDNCCEDEDGNTSTDVIHSEENAIMKLARSNASGNGASIFVTHQPCVFCSRLIANAGIKEVYFNETYRCDAGLKLLARRGIKVVQV